MHPDNPHLGSYDLDALIAIEPRLKAYLTKNKRQEDSINFFIPEAVHLLNLALLKAYHKIIYWHEEQKHLTPAVPGRCDHLLYLRDFLFEKDMDIKQPPKFLDIGTGASCIYPILGTDLFECSFVGSEVNPLSFRLAQEIITKNQIPATRIELRQQTNPEQIFEGIIKEGEYFEATICNPPFYRSKAESQKETQRKLRQLKSKNQQRNFRGLDHELWYSGGEYGFIARMINESAKFKNQVFWFSSLVAKESNLKRLIRHLNKQKKIRYEVINFSHGNKRSRILAWQYK